MEHNFYFKLEEKKGTENIPNLKKRNIRKINKA